VRSWPRILLLLVPLLLLGSSEPAGEVLRLRVLVVVYPATFSDIASIDEVENIWRELREAADFIGQASGKRLDLDIERAVVERYVPREDFEEIERDHYWLNDQVDGKRIVEDDLLALGHAPDRYDMVAVFYAFENSALSVSFFGAASIGPNRVLGRAAYLAVPLAWEPSQLNSYFEHEFIHCLESIFSEAGHTDFPHLHNGWAFEGTYGTQKDWHAYVLGHIPYQDYFAKPGPWGTIVRR
jgi:hypothetical protein